MRIWVFVVTICSLLIMPFMGSSGVLQNESNLSQPSNSKHHASMKAETVVCEHMEGHSIQSGTTNLALEHCCDEVEQCKIECSVDCEHCLVLGFGGGAVAPSIQIEVPARSFSPAYFTLSLYSLLLAKDSPPPVIA
ncbi:hypothetical protein [Aliidiomarina quisquiliarum]|uniref:hypothetical protein n=1 Tax=Aliidiomarina quisquiliarum TaxID=2938947 RepID=UPI00208F8D48|nr:hypothetical protein [Aliidiomarina quisquiliarum]MCO4321390.1 hypothetical protein [Aliidiomarina quisquiliarum]